MGDQLRDFNALHKILVNLVKGCQQYKSTHKMSLNIPVSILALKGQVINKIEHNLDENKVIIRCRRDKRRAVIDPLTGRKGRINRLVPRSVRDTQIAGLPCWIEIELAQVFLSINERRKEHLARISHQCYQQTRLLT